MNDYKPETGDKAEEILKLARERRRSCIQAESKTRAEANDDLKFAAGEQWPEQIRKFRESDPTGAQPCLTVNKTGKFIRQVVNDSRQNSPAIYVFPIGDGADKDTAKVFNGLIRDCEQRTDADIAYDTAIESAARVGEGYWRLITRYVEDQPVITSEDAFKQEIAYQRIRNFSTVHIDPSALCPAGSDARFAFVDGWMSNAEFKNKYGEEAMAGLDARGLGEYAPDWMIDGSILVADYYSVEKDQSRTLAMLKSGAQVILEEMTDEVPEENIVAQRKVDVVRCVLRKITGNKVLEKTVWPSRFIPVFRVIGEEFEVDGEVIYQGLVRPQKDSQRMYNYWISSATQKGALETKAPYIGAEGQFEGHEQKWQQANRVPFAYLEYKPIDIDGTLAPPPQRNVSSFAGMADIQMSQIASEDMKDTAGIYNSGLGERSNETSGIAIAQRRLESDTSNFHFIDNLSRAIRQCGRVLVDVLPKYYSKEEVVRIVGEDDEWEMVKINGMDKDNEGREKRINDITVGRYDARVNVGPSYATRRLQAADSMMQFATAIPQAGQAIMDLLAKAMDWPGSDMIAERIKKIMPPEFSSDEEKDSFTMAEVQQFVQQAMMEQQQQFEATIENRETTVKEFEAQAQAQVDEFNAMTKRIEALEKMRGGEEGEDMEEELREKVADLIAEYISGVNNPA